MEYSIILQPEEEAAPAGITDGLCQFPILHEIGYSQLFVGNEIVRSHKRVRRFPGEIFTLPDDFEIALRELFASLFAA
jgi:hypothetical protein